MMSWRADGVTRWEIAEARWPGMSAMWDVLCLTFTQRWTLADLFENARDTLTAVVWFPISHGVFVWEPALSRWVRS